MGRVQQLLKREFVFQYLGMKFQYLPTIKGSYDYLLIGKSNEPETQTFLNNILGKDLIVNFIDVGASVGEFVFTVSKHRNVQYVYAFEPRKDCAEAIRMTARLNNLKNITVFQLAVNDSQEKIRFFENPGGSSSGFYKTIELNQNFEEVESITLDSVMPLDLINPIILVDVEGAELSVLNGGKKFIDQSLPLIIFEYNDTSKRHYDINEIVRLLGINHKILRLRGDGCLDYDLQKTWNCVAVHMHSKFYNLIQPLIKEGN